MSLGIGLVGADGTGKTTLLRALQGHYGARLHWITEVARKVILRGFPLGKAANQDSYIELVRNQFDAAAEAIAGHKPFVSERTILDAYCYSVVNARLPRPYVSERFIEFLHTMWQVESRSYAFYFYIPREFPLEADGV